MSTHFSYFNRNNSIFYNSEANTGQNPVTELFFGNGFSRFIFDIDLNLLKDKVNDKIISTGCTTNIKHHLKIKNTSSFDKELLNTKTGSGRRRASSFDLILFRIPNNQQWDEGVGYDSFETTLNTDKAYSNRPSNWYNATIINEWTTYGLYDNNNQATGTGINFSALTIVDTQHFEFGNEDINFDMTDEINDILTGATTGITGWGIAFYPQVEKLHNLGETYSVGFFTRHTQTFYEPYLETVYDDLILDDRNMFTTYKLNKLYLYAYNNGEFMNLDENPTMTLYDNNDEIVLGCTGLTTCLKTKGVYEVTIPNTFNDYLTPCMFFDRWENIKVNGIELPYKENQLIVESYDNNYTIGLNSLEPQIYGFDLYGILQNEKIINSDIRKVGVIIKEAYSTEKLLTKVKPFYRVYVKEGNTEVSVQDWTEINRTSNEYYFIFDTRDKIPNQYYIDIKVSISGQKDTYKKVITFQIVDEK